VPLCFNGISSCIFACMGFPLVFRLEAYPRAFGKDSRNRNTETQRAQRGWKIQKSSVTSVPLCFNGISSCIIACMGFPLVFRLEAYPRAFGKDSRNRNTEAQRGWEIQKSSVTSVPLCFNGISSCIFACMGFPLVFRLETYPRAFGKDSRNRNTEAQRAQRGWEIQKSSVTSVPLCFNGIISHTRGVACWDSC